MKGGARKVNLVMVTQFADGTETKVVLSHAGEVKPAEFTFEQAQRKLARFAEAETLENSIVSRDESHIRFKSGVMLFIQPVSLDKLCPKCGSNEHCN